MATRKTFGRPSADIDLDLDEGTEWESPITGKTYVFKLIKVHSSKIPTSVTVSSLNPRNQQHLSLADVSDLYPLIKAEKGNTFPVRAVGTKDELTILEGSRRSYCVSKIEDAYLNVLLTPEMDLKDQAHIATIADIYRKPTTIDVALHIEKEGLQDKSHQQIADMLKISKTTAFNAKKILSIPQELYSLFPGLSYITVRFLTSLKGKEDELGEIINACSAFTEHMTPDELEQHNSGTLLNSDIYTKAAKAVEKEITEYIKKPSKQFELPPSYAPLASVKGVKIATNASGEVKLTLSKELAEGKAEQLRAILES